MVIALLFRYFSEIKVLVTPAFSIKLTYFESHQNNINITYSENKIVLAFTKENLYNFVIVKLFFTLMFLNILFGKRHKLDTFQ